MLLNKRISIFYFLNQIKRDLIIISIYAVLVGVLDHYAFLKDVIISISLTAILGTAISLLLAFRTSQAYERWWEARTVWGAIVNDSRTLIRQIQLFTGTGEKQSYLIKRMANRQIIWCHAMGYHLRRLPYPESITSYLEQNGIKADNVPNILLSYHSRDIRNAFEEGYINKYQQIQLDTTIARLCDALGKCERIKNTVFPKSYSLIIHFVIYSFVTILPFGLKDELLVVEILVAILIPSIFIAIEKTAILMQDPFENRPLDTPMTTMANTIERNIRDMQGEELPARPVNNNYFEM